MAIDTEKELFQIKELVEENNKILHRMQRKSRFATLFSIVKWSVIVLVAFGAYTFLQPIIGSLMTSYSTIVEGANQIKDIKNDAQNFDFKDLFKKE